MPQSRMKVCKRKRSSAAHSLGTKITTIPISPVLYNYTLAQAFSFFLFFFFFFATLWAASRPLATGFQEVVPDVFGTTKWKPPSLSMRNQLQTLNYLLLGFSKICIASCLSFFFFFTCAKSCLPCFLRPWGHKVKEHGKPCWSCWHG